MTLTAIIADNYASTRDGRPTPLVLGIGAALLLFLGGRLLQFLKRPSQKMDIPTYQAEGDLMKMLEEKHEKV